MDARSRISRIRSRTARAALLAGTAILTAWLAPSGARADSVSLTWTAPGDDGSVGRASAYDLRYSETPIAADTASWWSSATPVGTMPAPLTAGSRESFIVAGLGTGKTFYFVIRASDEVPNLSGYSNVAVKQTTGGTVNLATPTSFSASASEGAVVLTWDAVPAGGPELGYRLYRQGATDLNPALLATLPLSTASYSDSTRAAGERYDFALATYGASGESPRTSLTVTIPAASVDAPVVHGYPNPARDQVTFRLRVDGTSDARMRVTVFDLTGHRICLLANAVFPPGEHAITWACRSDGGYRVAPGIYNVIVEGPAGRAFTRLAIVP